MVKLVKVVVVTEGGCESFMMSTKKTSSPSRYVSLLHFCLDYFELLYPIHAVLLLLRMKSGCEEVWYDRPYFSKAKSCDLVFGENLPRHHFINQLRLFLSCLSSTTRTVNDIVFSPPDERIRWSSTPVPGILPSNSIRRIIQNSSPNYSLLLLFYIIPRECCFRSAYFI